MKQFSPANVTFQRGRDSFHSTTAAELDRRNAATAGPDHVRMTAGEHERNRDQAERDQRTQQRKNRLKVRDAIDRRIQSDIRTGKIRGGAGGNDPPMERGPYAHKIAAGSR